MPRFFVILLLLWALPASGQVIEEVRTEGLYRTDSDVVLRELTFEVPGPATPEDIEESLQRLRNLGIFRVVEHRIEGEDQNVLVIRVDEKWTLLPIFSLQSGGRLNSLILGGFDANAFGRFLQVGGRYQRLGDTNSFVFWLYDPRFLGQRQFGGIDLWWANRIRTLYSEGGELEGGYLRLRQLARLFYEKELSDDLFVGGGLTFQRDTFSYDLITDEVRALQTGSGLPEDTLAVFASGSVRVGRMDIDNYLVEGTRFVQSLSLTMPGSSFSSIESGSQVTSFIRLPYRQNIGARFGLSFTSATELEQQFFIGGFDTIRGYLDSRFRGSSVWYSNLEYRISSLDYRWLALQHIAFVDAAGVSDRVRTLGNLSGASTGVGLRIMVPKIYSVVIRVDYAFPLIGETTSGLSFGAQQFF